MALDFLGVGGVGAGVLAAVCVIGLALAALLYTVMTYNRLITLRNRVENAWAQIDVQLKRRYDLIPNLIETVKGYMKHERGTLTEITKYRAQLLTGSVEERAKANNMLSQTLKSLFAVAENYPQLKASDNFMHLQRTLTELEEQLSAARRAFNAAVTEFNNAVEMIPTSVMAGWMGLTRRRLLETRDEQRQAPSVAQSGEDD